MAAPPVRAKELDELGRTIQSEAALTGACPGLLFEDRLGQEINKAAIPSPAGT